MGKMFRTFKETLKVLKYCLFISYKNNKYIIDYTDKPIEVDIFKGMGILSIYMNSFIVLICEEKDKTHPCSYELANQLIMPKTLSIAPSLRVKYQLLYTDAYSIHKIENYSSLILITIIESNNHMLTTFPIDGFLFKKDGYFLNDTWYNGLYSIVHITKNPFDPQHKLLVIVANDETMVIKNCYLRRFFIPSYSSGLHPYFNSRTFIFNDKGYITL